MTEEFDKDGVMRRIQKLLAIAGDDRANPAEAAAAAGMAEKIMRKYQIDHSDLVVKELKSGTAFAIAECVANAKTNGTPAKAVPPWASMIALRVARYNDCGCTISWLKDGQKGIRFYGYESDVQVAKWTFDYLVATVNRLGKEFFARLPDKKELFDYRRGVATGICASLLAAEQEKDVDMQSSVSGRELVIVKDKLVSAHFGAGVMGEKTRRQTAVRSVGSFSTGLEDGSKVDVNLRGIQQNGDSIGKIAG